MSIGFRQLRHGHEIAFDLFESHRPRVTRDIVCTREDHHGLRLQRNDVRTEADQHLRRGLPADASIDIRLAGKEFAVAPPPRISNRVAHEDDSLLA